MVNGMVGIITPNREDVIRFGDLAKDEFKSRWGYDLDDVKIIPRKYQGGLTGDSYVEIGESDVTMDEYFQKTITHELEHHALYRELVEIFKEKRAMQIMSNNKLHEGLAEVVSLDEICEIYDERTLD